MAEYNFESVKTRREEFFTKWDAAYDKTKAELEELIKNFDSIKSIEDAVAQDLTINFYTIHLCNFFFFHVRKQLVESCKGKDSEYFLTNGFSNESWLPPEPIMDQFLSFLLSNQKDFTEYRAAYKKILKIRNKYAHGATNETTCTLTIDEFIEIYENLLKIKAKSINLPLLDSVAGGA